MEDIIIGVDRAKRIFQLHGATGSGEGFGKTRRVIHFQQEIRDPNIWQSLVQVQNEVFGFSGNGGAEPFELQRTVFDAAARNGVCFGGSGQAFQCLCHASLAVCQPIRRIERHDQSRCCLNGSNRHEGILQISITPGMGQPNIARTKGLAQMEQDRHFPKPMIAGVLGRGCVETLARKSAHNVTALDAVLWPVWAYPTLWARPYQRLLRAF